MASDRLRYFAACLACAAASFAIAHLGLGAVARWAEVERDAYLWPGEEWLQVLVPDNFAGRGEGRLMMTGSSEGREGFLPREIEAELPGVEVYNNSLSNHTLGTLLLVLRYLEQAYGEDAMPDGLVVGVTPWFLLDDPANEVNFLPGVLNRYTASFVMNPRTSPPSLEPKDAVRSWASRYRFLTRQSRRYQSGLLAVWDALAPVGEGPGRVDLVPSYYHRRAPISQREQLDQLLASPRSSADPTGHEETIRAELDAIVGIAERHDVRLYFVNMPQSTYMIDEYFGASYDLYVAELRRLVDGRPYLDLARFLDDSEFYDILHPDWEGARRVSRRVARFVAEAGAAP